MKYPEIEWKRIKETIPRVFLSAVLALLLIACDDGTPKSNTETGGGSTPNMLSTEKLQQQQGVTPNADTSPPSTQPFGDI